MLVCINLCHFHFWNNTEEEERSDRFAFIVFQMSCYCKCFTVVGWSAVYGCSISCSYSLTFLCFRTLACISLTYISSFIYS